MKKFEHETLVKMKKIFKHCVMFLFEINHTNLIYNNFHNLNAFES
jgi:hypothetical protein